MEQKSTRLVSPGVRQTEGESVAGTGDATVSRNGRAGDPNMAGWKDTTDTIDPMSGPMNFDNDNECYKRFVLTSQTPESALGHSNDVLDRDPPAGPVVVRRDGGEHDRWGVATGRLHDFGGVEPPASEPGNSYSDPKWGR